MLVLAGNLLETGERVERRVLQQAILYIHIKCILKSQFRSLDHSDVVMLYSPNSITVIGCVLHNLELQTHLYNFFREQSPKTTQTSHENKHRYGWAQFILSVNPPTVILLDRSPIYMLIV